MEFADTDQAYHEGYTLSTVKAERVILMLLSVGYHIMIEGRRILSDGFFGGCSQLQ